MSTTSTALTNSAWTQIATGKAGILLQARGDVWVYLGATAPALTAPGFALKSGAPTEIGALGSLGGGVWAKSSAPTGGIVHAAY